MSVQMGKIERKIRDILKATGLPWDMIPARKHWLLYLDGQMVGVLSRGLGGGEADAGTRHIESHIKRFVKQHADRNGAVQRTDQERVSHRGDGPSVEVPYAQRQRARKVR